MRKKVFIMKRILCLVLAAAMVLSLCSCGGGKTGNDSASSKAGTSAGDNSTGDGSTGDNSRAGSAGDSSQGADEQIDVESGLFNVTITVPASFLDEGVTQEDLNEQAKENGIKSITLNADGSATYIMSKAKHKEMMDDIRQSIDEGLKEMENSEDYPDIVSAKANSDYTQFTITMNTEELGLEAAFLPLVFYIYSGMYHAFNGTEPENVNIQFISAKTGEMLEEYNSKDME